MPLGRLRMPRRLRSGRVLALVDDGTSVSSRSRRRRLPPPYTTAADPDRHDSQSDSDPQGLCARVAFDPPFTRDRSLNASTRLNARYSVSGVTSCRRAAPSKVSFAAATPGPHSDSARTLRRTDGAESAPRTSARTTRRQRRMPLHREQDRLTEQQRLPDDRRPDREVHRIPDVPVPPPTTSRSVGATGEACRGPRQRSARTLPVARRHRPREQNKPCETQRQPVRQRIPHFPPRQQPRDRPATTPGASTRNTRLPTAARVFRTGGDCA